MDTVTLISELRDWAAVQGPGSLANILTEAADHIEQVEERLSIVGENLDAVEAEFDELLQEIGVREG